MQTVQNYIPRELTNKLLSISKQFPVVFLTGPRQSGKTTLLKNEFSDYKYLNLEDPDIRQWAIREPNDFLQHNPAPIIIDEAQYAPELFSYLQIIIDSHNSPGQFILSGSQNFLLMNKITQSLAGRAAVISLLPFSYKEIKYKNLNFNTEKLMLIGFYPRLYQQIKDFDIFYKSYINTYVERDIRNMANISNMNDFIRFMRICAGRAGQLLNISSMATDCGIAINTCKAWLSYLSASYIIHLVQPYYKNFNKRIIKSPKLFFIDTGLLCYLLGISSIEQLTIHPFRGNIFENLFFIELLKNRFNQAKDDNVWYWRDNHGTEIDFIIEKDMKLDFLEVKVSKNIHPDLLLNLKKINKYNPSENKLYLIYDGKIEREIDGIKILNWRNYFI